MVWEAAGGDALLSPLKDTWIKGGIAVDDRPSQWESPFEATFCSFLAGAGSGP